MVKALFGVPAFHIGVPDLSLGSDSSGKQQLMAQVIEPLPPLWVVWFESQALASVQLQLLAALGE